MATPVRQNTHASSSAPTAAETPLHQALDQLVLAHDPADDLLAQDLSLEDSFELASQRSSGPGPERGSPRTPHAPTRDRQSPLIQARNPARPSTALAHPLTEAHHYAAAAGDESALRDADQERKERLYSYTGSMGVLASATPPAAPRPNSNNLGQSVAGLESVRRDNLDTGAEQEEDEDDTGYSVADTKRRQDLRRERNDLRLMNGYLEDILQGLEKAEEKMEVSCGRDPPCLATPSERVLPCFRVNSFG